MTMAPFTETAAPLELLVVLGAAVIDVDERSGHVAVDGVGVEGRAAAPTSVPTSDPTCSSGSSRDALNRGGATSSSRRSFGVGKEHVIALNLRVPPPFAELRQNPLGVLLVVG
jgi:hypothetical protein